MDVRNYFVSDRNFFIFKTYNVIIIAMEKAFRIFTVITVSVMTLFFVSCEADETLSSEKMNDECIIDNSLNDLKIPKEQSLLH